MPMERHVQSLLNKVSFASVIIATVTLLSVVLQTPQTCISPRTPPQPHHKFPRSSCDSSPRPHLSLDKKNRRLWSSKTWRSQVSSFSQFFSEIRSLGLLHNDSRVLCVSAGAGHEVMALNEMGASDVTGIEIVESLPLVRRADPHNLPFFDEAFDLAFSAHFVDSLFPGIFVAEMERTVVTKGVCVVVVEECGEEEVKEIARLFRNSRFVGAANVTLIGARMTRIIVRKVRVSD